jgi:hypothetical protein
MTAGNSCSQNSLHLYICLAVAISNGPFLYTGAVDFCDRYSVLMASGSKQDEYYDLRVRVRVTLTSR